MNYYETIERWYEIQAALAVLYLEEKSLREGLFNGTFQKPKEGVNSIVLPEGRGVLKGTYKLNRNFTKDFKANVKPVIPKTIISQIALPQEVIIPLINCEYSLRIGPYRELTDEQRNAVDAVLEIKPGLPGLELVLPKKEETE